MRIFAVLFLFVISFCANGQTGFFFTMDGKTNCDKPLFSFDGGTKYCVTEEAIIKASEFKVEGGLQSDLLQKNQYFNLRFTKSGFESLKLICKHFPEKKLLLVVEGKVAGEYNTKGLKPTEIMPISGKADSKEITWVYETLKQTH